jgi:putative ABC transport system ATP-binding protein
LPEIDVVQLEAVTKAYGSVTALSRIDLSIPAGRFVALMGKSGCGKSTLLNLLGGMDTPDSGRVVIDGRDLSHLSDSALTAFRRERIGFIFQFFNLLPTLTVYENVTLPLQLAGRKPDSAQVQALLAQLGVDHRAQFFPAQLSGGEMQRVAIARALILKPPLILADEPTGNLDTENGRIILDWLHRLTTEGHTVIMATHSEEAASAAHTTLRMRDGQLV